MGEPLPKKKSKLLTWTAVAIIAIIITSVILYVLYVGPPATQQLSDPENDVVVRVGTQYRARESQKEPQRRINRL